MSVAHLSKDSNLATTTHSTSSTQHGRQADVPDPVRRDFLMIATGAMAAGGAAMVAWPLISQMNPDASVRALASIELDLTPIQEGQAITIKWRGNPVFIRNRTKAEVEAAKAVKMDELKDPVARNANVKDADPATDENRVVKNSAGAENILVMMAVCTHLGCVPLGNEGDFAVVEGSTKTGGWFCPCHGSHYDTAGRIRKGPAPQNLPVPQYKYLSDTKIQIG
jgi:ubiquinol-cytochrome c reductase iron-sulfur subunit